MNKQFAGTYGDVISTENLLAAWQEFVSGKRSKKDVQDFALHLADNIVQLHSELASSAYRHSPYQAFKISDPKPRHIHKAIVRDRVLHHAVYRKLYPFFDRVFISDSYSCRTEKGMHKALNRFRLFARQASANHTRTAWVLKCDIRKFFANIDHGILLNILADYIPDLGVLLLSEEIISSFTVAPGRGLPLGNLTSQLFCNLYMNELDQFIKHKLAARHYIRYADDFVLLSPDRAWLEAQLLPITEFLSKRLRLSMHPDKVYIKTAASGVDFLGWVHFSDHRVLRTASKRRMWRRIHEHPTVETLQSYRGLLSHGNAHKLEQEVIDLYELNQPS
jgi:retron-type reverse transcriptase